MIARQELVIDHEAHRAADSLRTFTTALIEARSPRTTNLDYQADPAETAYSLIATEDKIEGPLVTLSSFRHHLNDMPSIFDRAISVTTRNPRISSENPSSAQVDMNIYRPSGDTTNISAVPAPKPDRYTVPLIREDNEWKVKVSGIVTREPTDLEKWLEKIPE